MAKLSREITGKVRSCLFVLSALSQQGPKIARLLQEKLEPRLEVSDETNAFLTQIRSLARLLRAALDLMVALDRKLYDEIERRATLLADRDRIAGTLGAKVTGLRRVVQGLHPAAPMERLALAGRTLREPIALLRQSELICERLRSEDLDELLGESQFGVAIDLEPLALPLDTDAGRLREAYEAYQRSRRRVDQLRLERKEEVKYYNTAFLRVARQFEDLCHLAGETELAAKVRPSRSRLGQTAVEPVEGEEPESLEEVPQTDSGAGSGPSPGAAAEPS